MTQEEKELLLKDLCARLPYGVNIQVYYEEMAGSGYFDEIVWIVDNDEPFHVNDRWIENIKIYLRPMSSMTEEEKKEISILLNYEFYIDDDYALVAEDDRHRIRLDLMQIYIDWLNAHHFDYRDLIEKGLVLEAPEGMYQTN